MFCMWHPKLGWGAPRPTLFEHKIEAVRGTGLTLAKIREMGWRWIEVEVPIEKLVPDKIRGGHQGPTFQPAPTNPPSGGSSGKSSTSHTTD